jgi:hypothetical protein
MSEEARTAREAARQAQPFAASIGHWQAAAVRLDTLGRKLQSSGRHDPSLLAEAEAMLNAVREHAAKLDAAVAAMPPAIARHTRMQDVIRATRMVEDRLLATATLLGGAKD